MLKVAHTDDNVYRTLHEMDFDVINVSGSHKIK